jgi:hypothetical protein
MIIADRSGPVRNLAVFQSLICAVLGGAICSRAFDAHALRIDLLCLGIALVLTAACFAWYGIQRGPILVIFDGERHGACIMLGARCHKIIPISTNATMRVAPMASTRFRKIYVDDESESVYLGAYRVGGPEMELLRKHLKEPKMH